MASLESKIYYHLFKFLKVKDPFTERLDTGIDKRAVVNPPRNYFKKINMEKIKLYEKNVFRFSENNKKHVIYFHGGAYVCEPILQNWYMFSEVLKKSKFDFSFPLYPLAPENTYKQTFEMVIALYESVIKDNKEIIVMGDSAGGGLALAMSLLLKEKGIPQPSIIILLSPFLDATCSDIRCSKIEPVDVLLAIKGLVRSGKLYAGDLDPSHHLISPINGDFDGLPEITIFTSTADLLYPDSLRLKEKLEQQGTKFNYFEYKDVVHDWMIFRTPEARDARKKIAEIINEN